MGVKPSRRTSKLRPRNSTSIAFPSPANWSKHAVMSRQRRSTPPARCGREEFACVLPGGQVEDPSAVAERFCGTGRRAPWLVMAGGAVTSLVAVASVVLREGDRQPVISIWLLASGLALAALGLQAIRRERLALPQREARPAERGLVESARNAAETRSWELAVSPQAILVRQRADGTIAQVSSASRRLLGYEPEALVGRWRIWCTLTMRRSSPARAWART
jgi:PAS domain-containing protein